MFRNFLIIFTLLPVVKSNDFQNLHKVTVIVVQNYYREKFQVSLKNVKKQQNSSIIRIVRFPNKVGGAIPL